MLCAASLVALNKKDGGIRPIIVSETLRRLTSKALLLIPAVCESVRTLGPRQTGVAVAKATELIGMSVQRFFNNSYRRAIGSLHKSTS